jgi:hypothetical protein
MTIRQASTIQEQGSPMSFTFSGHGLATDWPCAMTNKLSMELSKECIETLYLQDKSSFSLHLTLIGEWF